MARLEHRKILLGVTGGIAAYKSAELVRRLRDAGAEVRVVMTPGASAFITPLTMQALSGNPVHRELLDENAEAAMGHIELARWAELVLIAPASADFIARLAHGLANDLLSTLCLAATAPVYVVPAMNRAMWGAAATQHNCALLAQHGITLLGPASGSQACGDRGPGRMLEPQDLLAAVDAHFGGSQLAGVRVLIDAGPTREAIDPVRYISNNSSGRMGFALAAAAAAAGAEVALITGPVNLATPRGVTRVDVTSAQQMHDAVLAQIDASDIFIACAAVADYRPASVAAQKIKKTAADMQIELIRNPDILAAVTAREPHPFTVGFAAETHDVLEYARGKLQAKRLDLIIANDVSRTDIGFDSDHNEVTLIAADATVALPRGSKIRLAHDLVAAIAARYHTHRARGHA
ncbi:MAG TPA: bifunctional phosphopantothenoylcysteine decarboxylase/phosphopantothenate--cysteine ligase CoaBC [Pseudomonadales bacterium]|nr:bifunctional phosphopantothenoylcysteine decarboxylase/phosphopantothenate--cysteine ligase CoaBC [Pseudomonadales bacterium]HND13899.1 bifunctional phosphopantothenoylcysteine decarboxylase/phosphopantothenate--cysteine ligase CoaBC [Pseudomonadales bacterium]